MPWAVRKYSIEETISNADVLIIMTPWDAFKALTVNDLKKYMRGKMIIDPYHTLQGTNFTSAEFEYFTLGQGCLC
ncbi:MAG: hypothetical protein ACD_46C00349G0001 [uncultured bacterium]|nr:MAG: hypothetical protein ACD_46C00349G0001 [uncultured bacterium]